MKGNFDLNKIKLNNTSERFDCYSSSGENSCVNREVIFCTRLREHGSIVFVYYRLSQLIIALCSGAKRHLRQVFRQRFV